MTTVSPKLNRLVNAIGNAIMERHEERFPTDDYVAELIGELKKYDLNTSEFRDDIARSFVRYDVARRANVNPFAVDKDGLLVPSLFRRARFRAGIIRLGNRMIVKMSNANSHDWIARGLHQQNAATAAQQAATLTTRFLQTEPGILLMENPRLKTEAAMVQLELWSEDMTDEEQDDEDGDGETE